MYFKKRGISPLIATVLLIGFIVALVAVVMLWGKGFIQEKAEKEGALAQAQLGCINVKMDVKLSGDNVLIVNKGTQIINGLVIRSGGSLIKCKPGDKKVCGTKTNAFSGLKQLESFDLSNINVGGGDIDVIPAIIPAGLGAPLIPCSEQMKTISI